MSKTMQELQAEIHKMAVDKGWWENSDGSVSNVVHDALKEVLGEQQMYNIATTKVLRALKDAKLLKERSPLDIHMLIVSEIAEGTEEARIGSAPIYWKTSTGVVTQQDAGGSYELRVGDELQKPEGELVELADAVIRIMDYCGYKGWDLQKAIEAKVEYNATRAHRHGGKKF